MTEAQRRAVWSVIIGVAACLIVLLSSRWVSSRIIGVGLAVASAVFATVLLWSASSPRLLSWTRWDGLGHQPSPSAARDVAAQHKWLAAGWYAMAAILAVQLVPDSIGFPAAVLIEAVLLLVFLVCMVQSGVHARRAKKA